MRARFGDTDVKAPSHPEHREIADDEGHETGIWGRMALDQQPDADGDRLTNRGVELLGHGDERDPVHLEALDELGDVGKQTLERRALHGCPGEATIGIRGADELPALMGLTLYVSLSRLALSIKTIEVLFEPMLGGFAGIDGAAQHPPLRGHRSAPASQRTWARSTSFP